MSKYWFALVSVLFALACNPKGDDTATGDGGGTDGGGTDGGGTDGGGTDGGGADGGTDTLTMDCAWDSSGLQVDLTNGDSAGYNFGMAETDCGGQCWTGEDCFDGYTASDGTVYNYCHPMSATGGYLTTVTTVADIVEGSTTVFSADLTTSYYLEEVTSGDCWTWGYDTTYYTGYGCADIGGGCTGNAF